MKAMNSIDLDKLISERDPIGETQAIMLTFFDECSATALKRWLIKGVVAIGETSSWIAPPGKGKSALQTDISVSIAAGRDWRGYRSKGSHGVVYFAFERGDLVKRRLTAYAKRQNLKALPIAVASRIIDLMHHDCVDVIHACRTMLVSPPGARNHLALA
jgi:RecA-family ATPase